MNSNLPATINKYLKKFGSENWKLKLSESKKYKLAIVIPALCEYENLRVLLNSFLICDDKHFKDSIIIFVINNLESASNEIKNDNFRSLEMFNKIIKKDKTDDNLLNLLIESKLNFGLVDVSSDGNGMPDKDGGVGLARKTGMDLALTIFDYDKKGKNILLCTDADSEVEENYITEVFEKVNEQNIKAGYVRFNHPIEGRAEEQKAIVCYEIFLRYYVLGLIYAESPYAIHTIGSTMLCDAETYVKIQGMNKRKAAEDFYFMEKLCKNADVKYINTTSIYPSGRGSWRVPFGTGQRVNRFLSKEINEYLLYSPKNFEILKNWLKKFNAEEVCPSQQYLDFAKDVSPELYNFLIQQNFERDWDKIIANNNNASQINKQKMFWFDGFRTLKLIHFLRDEQNPNINMFDALDDLFEKLGIEKPSRVESIPDLSVQIEYLDILKKYA